MTARPTALPAVEDLDHVLTCDPCQESCKYRDFLDGECACGYLGDMPIIGKEGGDDEAHCPVCGGSVYSGWGL